MTGRHSLLSPLGAALLGASLLGACASPSSGGGEGGTQGGAGTTGAAGQVQSGKGGTTGAAGTTGSAGSNQQTGKGGSTSGVAGSNPQGNGGSTGVAGSNPQGSGGSTGVAGSTTGKGGTTGAAGTGAAGTTGAGGGGNGNPNCPAQSGNVISDFEEGTTATTVNPAGGVWYAYKGMGTITPAPVTKSTTPAGIASATDGSGTCKGALHVVASGATDYSGFGATFVPAPTSSQLDFTKPYDVSAHKGISFKIKAGSGTPSAIYFGFKTRETAPMAEGGTLSDASSNNPDTTIGLRNNRGQILVSPWTSPAISTSWQTITIPFGSLVSRWVPAGGTSSNGCPNPGTGVAKCQAPAFNPANVLALEFGVFPDPGFPKPSGSTVGTYDVWVDDVQWVDDDSAGIPTQSGFPVSGAGSPGAMCTKPNGYDGKPVDGRYLVSAYNQWKKTFVSGNKVIRPENGNDTVSEGIAYGMLLAVNFNDKTTFDSLYGFWKSNSSGGLMTWCLPSGNNSCMPSGGGSATDADEDAAFALIQASKIFGDASYMNDAKSIISAIWSSEIDTSSNLPTGGSNYSKSTSSKVTNPSYFAPAYYRVFATIDSGHGWAAVADKSLSAINGLAGSKGLVPAWCQNNCASPGSNGGSNDMIYQYDSHRVPMRVGLDYCWNGTAAAKTYVDKITSFFATDAQAGKDGIGRISDLYSTGGAAASGSAPNSASIIGTAAVGAMASGSQKAFLDDAYQAVFDMATRGTMAPPDSTGKTPYSYYNATVGLLTLLIMTGNFSH